MKNFKLFVFTIGVIFESTAEIPSNIIAFKMRKYKHHPSTNLIF